MKENSREEDRKILEKLINTMKSDRELFDEKTDKEIYTFFINALEHILSDYKRVLKINEVLLKENEELKNKLSLKQFDINVVYNDYLEKLNEYKENSIPIQKIKDKIEELNKKEKKELKGMKGQDRYFVKQTYQNKRMILQELLESEEK